MKSYRIEKIAKENIMKIKLLLLNILNAIETYTIIKEKS